MWHKTVGIKKLKDNGMTKDSQVTESVLQSILPQKLARSFSGVCDSSCQTNTKQLFERMKELVATKIDPR